MERWNTVENMKPELPGHGSLKYNQKEQVRVQLIGHNELIIKLNAMISKDKTERLPIVFQNGK